MTGIAFCEILNLYNKLGALHWLKQEPRWLRFNRWSLDAVLAKRKSRGTTAFASRK
jgi:hypothetical protein